MSDRAWNNDFVQFARLLCEINATQEITIGDLCESMDLDVEHIEELFDRAHVVFENNKRNGFPIYNPVSNTEIEVLESDTLWAGSPEWGLDVGILINEDGLCIRVHNHTDDIEEAVVDLWWPLHDLLHR
jgi:hypothetical protein